MAIFVSYVISLFFMTENRGNMTVKHENNILFVYFSTRQIASTVDGHVNKTKNTNLTFTLLKTIRSDRCLHVLTNRMFDKRL